MMVYDCLLFFFPFFPFLGIRLTYLSGMVCSLWCTYQSSSSSSSSSQSSQSSSSNTIIFHLLSRSP